MLNIEKYKNELSKDLDTLDCQICALRKKGNCKLGDYCDECRAENIKWLCSEYKEPILNEDEKEYLKAVIKPFRNEVRCITKLSDDDWAEEYICICIKQSSSTNLPRFDEGMAYENMENGREYTLEELGL